ncbi:chromosome segregation protein SMC, partial [Neorhizobium sp. BETTINA12A]|nr:chromosome segregation protein SMC [Neorhizobium sp. BETTINA12A]
NERLSALDDPAERREAVEAAEIAVEDATIAAEDVEAALSAARSAELLARGPVEAARSALNALETEARTISKMLAAGATSGDFVAVADMIRVDRGFEAALGAALGEDLDSPVDAAAPTYWSVNGDGSGDPGLPQGAEPLIAHVTAPPELSRSLGQIG